LSFSNQNSKSTTLEKQSVVLAKQSVVYTNFKNIKTEFKEIEIEKLYTVVYTGSLQTRATSSLLINPEDNH